MYRFLFVPAACIALAVAGCSSSAPVPKGDAQTESVFQAEVRPEKWLDSERVNEWRAARADHRRIASTILSCRKSDDGAAKFDIDDAPRRVFSALLLDLTPDGDHVFRSETKNTDGTITLSAQEQRILTLSDSISRARVQAAAWASGSVDKVFLLGMITLVVSGLTTLFVTFQSRMTPPQPSTPTTSGNAPPAADAAQPAAADAQGTQDAPAAGAGGEPPKTDGRQAERAARPRQRPKLQLWPWSGYATVATIAVTLSVLGTSLAGVKQFYDPSRLLVQNQRTLLTLWKLHQDVVLGVDCKDKLTDDLSAWTKQLIAVRDRVIPPYGAFVPIEPAPEKQPEK